MTKGAWLSAAAAACLLAACTPPLPPLVRGLPVDIRLSRAAFDQRVRAAFPDGSSEASLLAVLARQGFTVAPPLPDGRRQAGFAHHGFPCNTDWRISWRPDHGRIRDPRGTVLWPTCL